MQVKSTIKLNLSALKRYSKAQAKALALTAEYLHTEVVQAQVMPFDTGNLQNESTFVDTSKRRKGRVTIVHSTPYARRLYYHPEYHFSKAENTSAGGKWYDRWLQGGSEEDACKEAFAQFYKQITGV